MSTFKKDIKDEEDGEERYEALAKKHPKFSKEFLKMAEDEEKHKETLKKMEMEKHNPKMHKSKVKSAAKKALGGRY